MNLRQSILHALKRVHPHLMPESALRVDVCLLMPSEVTRAELRGELNLLEEKGWTIAVRDEVTEELKWKLSDEGRALKIS